MEQKSWFLSKTIWLNLVLGLASVLSAVAPSLNAVTQWVNANTIVIASVWSVAGVMLRFVTGGKVTLRDDA